MCSQFGDLNDHVCDHLTMIAAVYFTTDTTQLFGRVNMIVNTVHCLAALIYMGKFGHYFKHSKSGRNIVMDVIESNNYWNIASVLWGCNYMAVPLIKLSYASSHGLSPTESRLRKYLRLPGVRRCVVHCLAPCLCVFIVAVRRGDIYYGNNRSYKKEKIIM